MSHFSYARPVARPVARLGAALVASVLVCLGTRHATYAAGQANASVQPDANSPAYIAEDPALAGLIGKPAPALVYTTLSGKNLDLSQIYGRKPVYLKLWATYCIPCRAQMPGFEAMYKTYGDRLSIVGVDIGFGETPDKVRAFVQRTGLTMPIVMDDGRLGDWLGIRATPLHVLIDRNGRIAYAGHQDGPALLAAIQHVIDMPRDRKTLLLSRPGAALVLKKGDAVPVFASGENGSPLVSNHADKAQALYFTAPWCETYLKDLEPKVAQSCAVMRQRVQTSASTGKLIWKAVAARLWTEPGDMAPYQAELGNRIPLVPDTDGMIFNRFGIRQIPAIALIDRTGHLRQIVDGSDSQAQAKIAAFAKEN